MKTAVGLVGVTGYTGQEILRLLLRHPSVTVRYCASRRLKSSCLVVDLLPSFQNETTLKVEPYHLSRAVEQCEILFLALPHGVAMEMVPGLLRKPSLKVIDLSGDFRLKSAAIFFQAYGLRHKSPAFLKQAVYGLSEWNRPAIQPSRLVANPGCYPTAVLLGLAPLAEAGLLGDGLIADAKSGITGAGRSAKEDLLFSEINEDLRAYKVDGHQHVSEMEQELKGISGRPAPMTFVPHLVPLNRGLYATLYAPLKKRISEKNLRELYQRVYGREPFVRLLPAGHWPQVKAVSGTNYCDIGLRLEPSGRRAIILSAIDNLGKGAAGQAVQNMNLMWGLPETAGLLPAKPVNR